MYVLYRFWRGHVYRALSNANLLFSFTTITKQKPYWNAFQVCNVFELGNTTFTNIDAIPSLAPKVMLQTECSDWLSSDFDVVRGQFWLSIMQEMANEAVYSGC